MASKDLNTAAIMLPHYVIIVIEALQFRMHAIRIKWISLITTLPIRTIKFDHR